MKAEAKLGIIGAIMMLFGFLLSVIETSYFGFNWIANSKAEKFCDMLSVLIFAIGLCFFMIAVLLRFLKIKL